MVWFYLAIAITAEVMATTALKFSEGFTKLTPSLFVAVGYAGAFYFLSRVLDQIPISIAYAIWSGAGIVLALGSIPSVSPVSPMLMVMLPSNAVVAIAMQPCSNE